MTEGTSLEQLTLRTKAYLLAVYALGAFILLQAVKGLDLKESWFLLGLCLAGTLASIFKVEGATNRSHYTISFLVYGFTFAALGISATLIVIAVSNLIEWLWNRPPWFIQLFNTTCYIIVMYISGLVYYAINPPGKLDTPAAILAISIAMATFTILNHLMVGTIVWLARGENFRKSGIFDLMPLMIDMTLLCLGASMVIVWNHNPFALALFSLPLYLIYSTLRVPSLERQSETDSMTGLFNHGYFMEQLASELKRANRFDRPLSIIMVDLDLLRNINNTYGHLAGDQVLIRTASIFKMVVREYDIVARFGGEEFAILIPEATVEEAFLRGEEIRLAIEKAGFIIPTSITQINVTVSIGISGRERADQPAQEIIHNADTALYHSKLKGRNQTYVCANQTYASFFVEQDPVGNRVVPGSEYQPTVTKVESEEEENYKASASRLVQEVQTRRDPEKPEKKAPSGKPALITEKKGSSTLVNLYIGLVIAMAVISLGEGLRLLPIQSDGYAPLNWLSLATFAIFVALTEWFSIELYFKHTSVSTSAVPILAGTLLFGPLGSLVLSATFAVTALIKFRSPISRLFFNFSNQLIAGMIYLSLITLSGRNFLGGSVPYQLVLCLIAALIVYLTTTVLVAAGIRGWVSWPMLSYLGTKTTICWVRS